MVSGMSPWAIKNNRKETKMRRAVKILSAIAAVGLLAGSAIGADFYKCKVRWAGAHDSQGMILLLESDTFPYTVDLSPLPYSGKFQYARIDPSGSGVTEVNISRALAAALTSLSAGTYVYAYMDPTSSGWGALTSIYATDTAL